MGDPKKRRKQYSTPAILWAKTKIEEEKVLMKDYGLKNKKELWRMGSKIKKFAEDAKKLIRLSGKQADIERNHLLTKLKVYGLLSENAQLDDILGLQIKDILERRLQTLVVRKGLARSMGQSRQFIVHRHVSIDGKKLTVPSFIVPLNLENSIAFSQFSELANPDHPERDIETAKEAAAKKQEVLSESKEEDSTGSEKSEDVKEEVSVKEEPKVEEKSEEAEESTKKKSKEPKTEKTPVKEEAESKKEKSAKKSKKESKEE